MHALIPLLILFIVILVAAAVGYAAYTIANDVADKTSQRMEKHNMSFSKDGMKVGVKQVKEEDYVSGTQEVLVKAWNYSSWPAYKSRFWNKEADINARKKAK